MIKLAKIIGSFLIFQGLAGFISIQFTTYPSSWTSLIPAFFGLPILLAAIWGGKAKCACSPSIVILLLSLLGFGLSTWRAWVKQGGIVKACTQAEWSGFNLYKWMMVWTMAMLMGSLFLVTLKQIAGSNKQLTFNHFVLLLTILGA